MYSWVASLPLDLAPATGRIETRHGDTDDVSRRGRAGRSSKVPATAPVVAALSGRPNRELAIPDDEIVARIRGGDGTLYERLFERYWEPLCHVASFGGQAPDEAREIVADVFAALWTRRESWSVTTSVEAYLFGAVRHRARRAYRDTTTRRALLDAYYAFGSAEATLEGDRATDDGMSAESVDVYLTVQQLVRQLPPRAQLAIYLRWHRELEYGEIGEIIGVSADAARKLATRTLATLRERLRR